MEVGMLRCDVNSGKHARAWSPTLKEVEDFLAFSLSIEFKKNATTAQETISAG
jgi:hypothetical protein